MNRLIDILVEHLEEWPENITHLWYVQGDVIYGKTGMFEFTFSGGWEKPVDYVSATVTKDQWQAAVDALKAEQESEPAIDWSKQPKGFPLWLEGTTEEHRKHSGWYRKNGEVYLAEIAGQWRASREGQFFTVHTRPVNPPVAAEQAAEIKWPDGAEFKGEGSDHFYRNVTRNSFEVWVRSRSQWETIQGVPSYQPLIPRQTERAVEWDGVSVPPAGTECEYRVGHGGWFKCSIRYVTKPYHDGPVEVVMFAYHLGGEQTGVVGSGEGELEFRSIRTQEQIEAEEREKAIEEIRKDTDYILDEICASAVLAAGYRKQVAE